MLYIALLRGINVGGHMVKMEKLRGLFKNLGFQNVRSYIQSGNIFLKQVKITEIPYRRLLPNNYSMNLGTEFQYVFVVSRKQKK